MYILILTRAVNHTLSVQNLFFLKRQMFSPVAKPGIKCLMKAENLMNPLRQTAHDGDQAVPNAHTLSG